MRRFSNNATTTLTSPVSDGASSLPVETAAVFPVLGAGQFCYATIQSEGEAPEIVKVTARDLGLNSLTVVREQEGTSRRSWPEGAVVELRLTADSLNSFLQLDSTSQTFSGTLTMSGVATVNGGTFNGQTFTNATITATTLNAPSIGASGAGSDRRIAFSTGAPPTIAGASILTTAGGTLNSQLGCTQAAAAPEHLMRKGEVETAIANAIGGVISPGGEATLGKTTITWDEYTQNLNTSGARDNVNLRIRSPAPTTSPSTPDDNQAVGLQLEFGLTGSYGRLWLRNDGTMGWGLGSNTSTPTYLWYCSSGGYFAATDFVVPSDRRLKENITPIHNPLDKVARLRGVMFDWRKDAQQMTGLNHPGAHDIGLIADEVGAVIPEIVHRSSFGYDQVSYAKLVPLLIEAVNSLRRRVEELERE